jgi:hypothetical protein
MMPYFSDYLNFFFKLKYHTKSPERLKGTILLTMNTQKLGSIMNLDLDYYVNKIDSLNDLALTSTFVSDLSYLINDLLNT